MLARLDCQLGLVVFGLVDDNRKRLLITEPALSCGVQDTDS